MEILLGGSPFLWPPPSVTVITDTSLWGWGAHINVDCVGGPWPSTLRNKHINYLELLAIYLALMSFSHRLRGRTVQVLSDNSTAVAYLNRQGGMVSTSRCRLAFSLWEFCIRNSIHPVALHVHEMEINWTYLSQLFTCWGMPDVDVFATQRNKKCNEFCCRKGTDPRSLGNGLLLPWVLQYLFMFSPVPLIPRVLQKLSREKPRCILIAPWWPRQVWFPLLRTLAEGQYLRLPNTPDLLYLPDWGSSRLTIKDLRLIAWLIQS